MKCFVLQFLYLGAQAPTTATATKTSLENEHLGNDDSVCDYGFFLAAFIVDKARCKWTDRRAVEVNIENERFTVACSRFR